MRSYLAVLNYYLFHPLDIFKQIKLISSNEKFSEPFIFIIGPPRSGTTLLHRLLLNHSQLCGFEEETAIFSFKSIYDKSRFKKYLSDLNYEMASRHATSLADFFVRIHKASLKSGKKFRYVEKTPQHSKWLNYITFRFPNAQFIFCIRDPRDTFCSSIESGVIPQSKSLRWHAWYFKSCCSDLMEMNSKIRSRVLVSRYEDLVADPAHHISRIMQFLNLSPETQTQIDVSRNADDPRSKRKEFIRLTAKIDSSSVARWKVEMSSKDVLTYQRITRDIILYFGYELL